MTRAEAKTALVVARVLSVFGAAIAWLAAGCGYVEGSWEACGALCPASIVLVVMASIGLEFCGGVET